MIAASLLYCALYRIVYPGRDATAVLKTIPVKLGFFQLQVVFSSAQLTDVMGDEDVTVTVA